MSRSRQLAARADTAEAISGPRRRGGCPRSHQGADPEVESVDSVQSITEGARRGREEASEVACPDREEDASEAQAAEEDLARQVSSVRCASEWQIPPCSGTSAITCRCRGTWLSRRVKTRRTC